MKKLASLDRTARRLPRLSAFALGLIAAGAAHAAADLGRLQDLLNATPAGGWVEVNTNTFSSAWPTGSTAVNIPSYSNPAAIVTAWSSFAWDSTRGDLLLWGGGHANYAGDEMYVWNAASGAWSRGSLPSRLDPNNFVIDNAAPQSAHTYDNSLYLPVNDRFVTFGGAAYQSGGNFQTNIGGTVQRAGPWMWDPSKANPNLVGGTNGSGYNTASAGGNMWTNRQGQWTGTEPSSYINGTTAYRTENGKDVVYLTADQNSSGFPSLYRYTVGDVASGGSDTWEKIGVMSNSVAFEGSGTIDSHNDLYIRTASLSGASSSDLAVWDLSKANAANPTADTDIAISLVQADGTPFQMSNAFGIDYDAASGQIVMWDGSGKGTVWMTQAEHAANGSLDTTWVVTKLTSATTNQPDGDFLNGVLGKWHYVSELGAYIALDNFDNATGDAGVWLYKPLAAVPEPETYALMLAGIGVLAWVGRRRGTLRA